jgi:hypothetical protein
MEDENKPSISNSNKSEHEDFFVEFFSSAPKEDVSGWVTMPEYFERYQNDICPDVDWSTVEDWRSLTAVQQIIYEANDRMKALLGENEHIVEVTGYVEPDFTKSTPEALSLEILNPNVEAYLDIVAEEVVPDISIASDQEGQKIHKWTFTDPTPIPKLCDGFKQRGFVVMYDTNHVYIVGKKYPIQDFRRLAPFLRAWQLNRPLSEADSDPVALVGSYFKPQSHKKIESEISDPIADYFEIRKLPPKSKSKKKNTKGTWKEKQGSGGEKNPFVQIRDDMDKADYHPPVGPKDHEISSDAWLFNQDLNSLRTSVPIVKTLQVPKKFIEQMDSRLTKYLMSIGSNKSLVFRGSQAFELVVRFFSYMGFRPKNDLRAAILVYLYRSSCIELDRRGKEITFIPIRTV